MTPYGGWYKINEKGMVYECDNGFKCDPIKGNGHQWDIIGATSTHPFSGVHIVPISILSKMTRYELLYKNGHPRYTVVDIDHGTRRIHGNTRVHGIKRVDVITL